jgi:hypothetical protein
MLFKHKKATKKDRVTATAFIVDSNFSLVSFNNDNQNKVYQEKDLTDKTSST